MFLGERLPHARTALRVLLPHDDITWCPSERAAEAVIDADVVVPLASEVDGALMDAGPIRLIHQFGAGLDGVAMDAARTRGLPVARIPTDVCGGDTAVAEIVVLHLLMLARRYDDGLRALQCSRMGEPVGLGVSGMSAVVVGMGAVGRATAAVLRALGLLVTGVGRCDNLVEALRMADVVVLCCPLTESTRGLIGRRELAAMPPGGLLVNVARGAVVDHDAMLGALTTGHLRGAGLDVFWEEPIDLGDPLLAQSVTTTPHLGSITTQVNQRMAEHFAANVERLRRGRPLMYEVA